MNTQLLLPPSLYTHTPFIQIFDGPLSTSDWSPGQCYPESLSERLQVLEFVTVV